MKTIYDVKIEINENEWKWKELCVRSCDTLQERRMQAIQSDDSDEIPVKIILSVWPFLLTFILACKHFSTCKVWQDPNYTFCLFLLLKFFFLFWTFFCYNGGNNFSSFVVLYMDLNWFIQLQLVHFLMAKKFQYLNGFYEQNSLGAEETI